jgi:hypothetical protein
LPIVAHGARYDFSAICRTLWPESTPLTGKPAKNIPHEICVKRMASLMANRNTGNGDEWRPYVERAIARYVERTGVQVDREAVLGVE